MFIYWVGGGAFFGPCCQRVRGGCFKACRVVILTKKLKSFLERCALMSVLKGNITSFEVKFGLGC